MMKLLRTNSDHPEFPVLVRKLDAVLAELDGDDHAFYAQFNKTAGLQYVVLMMDGDKAVSCGALRELEPGVMEVKRMFTLPERRGQGLAKQVLQELENWAKEDGYSCCRLETGQKQQEAIAMYQRCGYNRIPNFGQYKGVEYSVCFEKQL